MSSWSTLKKVLRYVRPHRTLIFLCLLFSAVTVSLTLYLPIQTGQVVDLLLGPGQVDFSALWPILLQMALCIALTALCQWLLNLCSNKLTFATVEDIRRSAFEHLHRLPLSYLDTHPAGEIVSRIIADVDQFAEGLLMGFTQLFSGVLTILGTLLFMLRIHPKITLAVVVITPLSLFVAAFIAKRTYSMFQLQSSVRGQQTALINEMVGQVKVVQAFGYEQRAQQRFDDINQQLQKASLRAVFFSSLTNPCTRFINGLVYAAVAVIGAFTAISGGISVGQLTCFLSYANQYTKPFNEISGVVTELQNALACADRVFLLMEAIPEEPDAAHAADPGTASGAVTLEEVSFSYTEKPLIRDLNLQVSPGQHIAIVGPTGCGKTTLINLLMRFYDVKDGRITVDGCDLRDMQRGALRRNYGMVLQETWLRRGTVRDNILMGKPDATEEEVIAAAKAAHAHSFIRRLEQGYDTVLGEDGAGLSQGQKQLLCIARVMLALPPMLILDEATSSIDTRTESRIQQAFGRMMQGRTSFIVAHRLSTVREADCILVMQNGRIVEQGSHSELLQKQGFYAQLYQSQFAGAAGDPSQS